MDQPKSLISNGNQLVIVALPPESDPVRKFSSVKEPHLTLLYLGDPGFDVSELNLVSGFVEHASSLLQPFGLEVQDRGVLGVSQADVLFFNKKWTKAVDTFRGQLLKNALVSKAFLSTSQFDEWNPHLTMGFPDNPAKKDDREFPGFSWVNFDRIAFWTKDSIGPTFKLVYSGDSEVAMSEGDLENTRITIEEILKHHGVKGMKWGVRNNQEGGFRSETSSVNIEPGLHKDTAEAARQVSGLIRNRYGYNIKNVKILDKNHQHYDPDFLAFVEDNKLAGGRNEATIFVQSKNMNKILKEAETDGWNAPGTGNTKGLLTHESAHSLFHSDQTVSVGLLGGQKVKGGNIKARDKALKAASKTARLDGQSIWDSSGYARTAGVREELEAELFSQYHWATDPPNFVEAWGKTLHQELGVDPTPFKEV